MSATSDRDEPGPVAIPDHSHGPVVSAGAGLAIAGIWVACSAVTVLVVLVTFTRLGGQPESMKQVLALNDNDTLTLLLYLGLPMVAAFWATKLVIGKRK